MGTDVHIVARRPSEGAGRPARTRGAPGRVRTRQGGRRRARTPERDITGLWP